MPTTRRRLDPLAGLLGVAFLLLIVAANWATSTYGMVPVGFGYVATAGTYFAGLTFLLRDEIHDRAGWKRVAALIVLGGGLSYLLADPFIALASAVAFLVAEAADLGVYAPLRRRGRPVTARLTSNTVGAVVDTFLFLAIAGFPITSTTVTGQLVGKLLLTTALVIAIGGVRSATSRTPRPLASEPR